MKRKVFLFCFLSSVFSLLILVFLASAYGAESKKSSKPASVSYREFNRIDLSNSRELPARRTRYSRTYFNSDGTFATVISAAPLFYKKGSSWLTIKSNIVRSGDSGFSYENKANAFEFRAAASSAKKPLIYFGTEEGGASFSLVEANSTSSKTKDAPKSSIAKLNAPLGKTRKITYPAVFKGADITYTLQREGVKEEIVLRDRSAPNSYLFELNPGSLSFTKDSLGRIVFKNESGKLGFTRIVTSDAGQGTQSVSYTPPSGCYLEVSKQGDNYVFTDKDGSKQTYSQTGELLELEDSNGNKLVYSYVTRDEGQGTGQSILAKISSQPNEEAILPIYIQINYNSAGKIASISDCAQRTVSYSYDSQDNLISKTDPEGNITRFTYNSDHDLTSITDANGNTTTFGYDEQGKATSIDKPDDVTTKILYEQQNNSATVTDANGGTTSYTYNENSNPTQITDPLGNITKNSYDQNGNITKEVDPLGNSTAYSFDNSGNQTSETDPLGNTSKTTYDQNNNPIKEIDALGNETRSSYDQKGNQTSETDPLGNQTSYIYDAKGNQVSETDPLGNTTTTSFDQSGNQTAQTDPLGNTSKTTYDKAGNVTVETDENGNTTTLTYDKNGQTLTETDPLGNIESHSYDSNGNETSTTDKNGNTTKYTLDANNQIIQTQDPESHISKITYDKIGLVKSKTDPNGNITTYNYDKDGRLIESVDAQGNISKTIYDKASQVIAEVDRRGFTTSYSYNTNGNKLSIETPDGAITKTSYDELGNAVSETNSLGGVTSYLYDAAGNQIRETGPLGAVNVHTFDKAGQEVSTIDPSGNSTSKLYDKAGNVISETDPEGHTTTHSYDPAGNLISQIDPNGGITKYSYDVNGNQISEIDKLGNTTKFGYDAEGNKTKETDPMGRVTTYQLNSEGQTTKITFPDGTARSYQFDANGNEILQVNPDRTKTSFEYDSLNHLTKKVDPAEGTTTYVYDKNGNKRSETTEEGKTTYTYDYVNRLASVIDPEDATTTYSYDLMGNKTTEISPSGATTTYSSDLNGRLISTTDSLGNQTSYLYDLAGNRNAQVSPLGTTTYTYDKNSQLIKETSPEGEEVSYIYDPNHNLIAQTDQNGTTTNFYDLANHIIKTIDPYGNVTEFTYNQAGEMIKKTVNGQESEITLDPSGKPTTFNDGSGLAAQSFDSSGRRTSLTYPNGMKTSYDYNPKGLISSVKTTYPDSSLLNGFSYAYSPSGKITQVSDLPSSPASLVPRPAINYTYSKRGELVSTTDSLKRFITYSYDSSGNRTSKTIGINYAGPYDNGKKLGINEIINAVIYRLDYKGNKNGISASIIEIMEYLLNDKPMIHGDKEGLKKTILEVIDGTTWRFTYEYNSANQLTSYLDPITSQPYTLNYDKQGNLTSKEDHLGTTNYKWNSRNRLTETDLSSGEMITYSYSPNGTRLTKSTSKGITKYSYDGIEIQQEITNGITTSFNYTPEGEPYSMRRSTQTYYYHLNTHGDVVSLTDQQGREVAYYSYGPWGNIEIAKGPLADSNPIRYAGYYYDSETGLYYLINRYYEPALGRFISTDPGRQPDSYSLGKNRYIYCGNDPVNLRDETGMWADTAHYELTLNVAKAIGFKYQITVARGAKDRDDPANFTFYHHFDWIPGILDSRKLYYQSQHNLAVKLAKQHEPLAGCYQLGLGVHSIQDYYAHGYILPWEHTPKCDNPKWPGDPSYKQDPYWGSGKGWPGYPDRFQVAKRQTKKVLVAFKRIVGKYF